MNKFLNLKTLSLCFPLEIPIELKAPNSLYTNYKDAGSFDEVEPFRNLRWCDVSCQLLYKNWEAPFFFTPIAMGYYFPAYIFWSIRKFNKVHLSVCSLLSILNVPNSPLWNEEKKMRWDGITKEQWKIIQTWLIWLSLTHGDKAGIDNMLDGAYVTASDEMLPQKS